MTPDAPVDALDRVLARTCHLLIDFDGRQAAVLKVWSKRHRDLARRRLVVRDQVLVPAAWRAGDRGLELRVVTGSWVGEPAAEQR